MTEVAPTVRSFAEPVVIATLPVEPVTAPKVKVFLMASPAASLPASPWSVSSSEAVPSLVTVSANVSTLMVSLATAACAPVVPVSSAQVPLPVRVRAAA